VPHIPDLTEYGAVCVVRESAWAVLQIEDAVELLASRGILSHRMAGGVHILEPAGYVGELTMPGRCIRILPRFPHLYDDLRKWLSGNAGKIVRMMAGMRDSDRPRKVHPALVFAKALEAAIDAGVPVTYVARRIRTSSPRGRLLISNTISDYHIRGMHHLAVCTVSSKTVEPSLASVIRAAGELAVRSSCLDRAEVARLDLCLDVFPAHESLAPDVAACLAEFLRARHEDNPELQDLLTAAIALFEQEALLMPFHQPALGGLAHFHKMDRLWELAIMAGLAELGLPQDMHASFHPFASKGQLLFTTGGPEVDPDVVVFTEGAVCAVIDAKYSLAGRAPAGDVYQITCYVKRLKARSGLLVYIAEGEAWMRQIGTTEDGAAIWEAGVPTTGATAALKELLAAYCHDLCGSEKPELRGSLDGMALQ